MTRVERYQVAGTNTTVYEALEPGSATGTHSTISSHDGIWWGRIGTRALPPEIDALPVGYARTVAVHTWYQVQYYEAYAAILYAYPQLITQNVEYDDGEIISWRDD